jgi:hypothetical protein
VANHHATVTVKKGSVSAWPPMSEARQTAYWLPPARSPLDPRKQKFVGARHDANNGSRPRSLR